MTGSPKPNQDRTSKGSVAVLVSNGRLQLRFNYGGKRYYVSLGLPDSKVNRKAAEVRAAQIERDIAYGEVDPTLAKYKPVAVKHTAAVTPEVTPVTQLTIAQLWEKYTAYRLPKVSPGTIRTIYNHVKRHIEKFPTQSLDEAEAIQLYLNGSLTPYSAKRILVQLSACCKWAIKAKLISTNPFQGMAAEIKVKGKKGSEDEDTDIHPFTRSEQIKIIQAFTKSPFYKRYTPLVQFLFATGCRPSEAIALEWRHWQGGEILFEQAITVNEHYQHVLKSGLKTQEKRRLPCNADLQELLKKIKPSQSQPCDLIFPALRGGKFINWYHFCSGPWKKVLAQCGIEYRKPYQTRHTFITQCVEAGISTKQVAKWVGNSEWVISQHYLGTLKQVQVPVMVPKIEILL